MDTDTPPRHLYKYLSLAGGDRLKWAERIFANNLLYFPTLEQLNDPLEGRFKVSHEGTAEARLQHFIEYFLARGNTHANAKRLATAVLDKWPPPQDQIDHVQEWTVDNVRRNSRILSLSAVNNHATMWAHYADQHKGICLQFDTTIDALPRLFALVHPVEYLDEQPTFHLYGSMSALPASDSHTVYESIKVFGFSKLISWSYEHEWRILMSLADGDQQTEWEFPSHALTGVNLGQQIESDHEQKVREWINRRDTPVQIHRVSQPPPGSYLLAVEPETTG